MLLETAQRLCAMAEGRHIPVRCNIRNMPGLGGGEGHFSRGSLIGIDGTKLLVKPYKHGGKTEVYEPELVHIWTSRCIQNGVFTQEQIDAATHNVIPAVEAKPLTLDSLGKKLQLQAALSGAAPKLSSDSEGGRLNELMGSLSTVLREVNRSAPSKANGKQNGEKKEAPAGPTFVIVDTGFIEKENRLRFFMGKGTNNFSDSLSDAFMYSGGHAEGNARRSIGQINRRPQHWRGVISSLRYLRVMSLSDALALQDKVKERAENGVTGPLNGQPVVEATELASEAIETDLAVDDIAAELEANAAPVAVAEAAEPEAEESEVEFEAEAEEVEAPAPQAVVVAPPAPQLALLTDPRVQQALGAMQASMANVQTAVDMLKDERQRLLQAQEMLISSVSGLVNGQLKIIDQAIASGNAALEGKR